MSNSPFAGYTNAVLRFQVPSGMLVTDSRGNPKPGTAVVEVTAMLEQVSEQGQKAQIEPRPGADSAAYYLEGFVVDSGQADPLRLPSIVTPNCPCAATWNGLQGEFFIEPIARSAWGYEALTGDEIKGRFSPSSFVVEDETWEPSEPPVEGTTTERREILTVETLGQSVFVLAAIAVQPQLSEVYINGLKETYGIDYSLNGVFLTWLNPVDLEPGDEVEIIYQIE